MTEIVHSTHDEQAVIWAAGTAEWGRSVGVDKYVERETTYRGMPTGRQGGMSYWVLTNSNVGAMPPSFTWSPRMAAWGTRVMSYVRGATS